jgi:hypothetical protein
LEFVIMSISLYSLPGVYQSSWIEMKEDVAMRYEIDRDNDIATLYFGSREEYVITIGSDNLDQFITLAVAAKSDLAEAS